MEKVKNDSHESTPIVFNEEKLARLCEQHKREIAQGNYRGLPRPRIRYVIDKNRFGFASFGDFFFWIDGGLYVWQQSKEFRVNHNPDIVEDYFGHPCEGRGYTLRSIFAGVDTGWDDSEGNRMFTGDIVLVTGLFGEEAKALCLASLCDDQWDGFYGFPLDNHSLTLNMCKENGYRLKRIGTVFYQLDWCDEPTTIWDLALVHNNDRGDEKTKRTMAKYTPNFDKDVWKYLGLEILGVEEFEWSKTK